MRFKLFKSNKKSHAKKDDLPRSSSSSTQEGPSRRGDKVADAANVFVDFMANIAEASDILSPLKAACRATKTILDTVQGIKSNQEAWLDLIQRIKDYLSALEEQITLFERNPPEDIDGPFDEAFSQPLIRYVKLLEDLHDKIVDSRGKHSSKVIGGLSAIGAIKIDAGDIQKYNKKLEDRHGQFMVRASPAIYMILRYIKDALNMYTAHGVRAIQNHTKDIKRKVDIILTEADYATIQQLPMVASAASSVHNTCLKGTRQAVLETIWRWAANKESPKPIFWLCDIAGSGKSTVAMSAVEAWKKEGTLGGTFFFSMAISEWSNTDKFSSTIARELAQYVPNLAPYIAKAWQRNPAILRSSFEEQFRMLISEPLQHQQNPVILVIDAIDECKSGRQRKELVETLSAATQESNNLRIFITSRPDPVIEKVLQPLSIKAKLTDRLHDTSHRDNIEDIATYVHQSLGGILSSDKRRRLVNKANGLFIWASTACRMLNDESLAIDPEIIYDRLISIDQPGAIDGVYNLVIARIDQTSKPAVVEMLGMLLAAFEPLTSDDLEHLIKHAKGQGSAKALVRVLGTVLKEDPITHLIQFRHPTFVEYLRRCCVATAADVSGRIYINISHAHDQVVSWCLSVLRSRTEGLKFNICQIESSFYLNRQIPDLEARVNKYISRRLRYASLHWPFHVSAMDDGSGHELQSELAHIVKSPFALYWMEVLSVTGGVMRAVSGLRAAAQRQSVSDLFKPFC
ncbi:related to S. pombe trp-asp repeat containing protein [Serendipita indica DSM 11827]|uniref:Related to S. pombe trp-asp repeat containing protein n=1 Tax=Serendipita indica (strain DSM 11827) TaxID=1109443 RepID=G4TYY9_SERID|nr:related to S. pombe trp-asp repeat containing protein [Serendipita indica DSM 11827]